MKLVSFNKASYFEHVLSNHEHSSMYKAINPGERIVVNDEVGISLAVKSKESIESISDFMPLYYGQVQRPAKFRGKKVLFYRGRGIGDQLIITCLSRFFTEKLGAICFQLCDYQQEAFWAGNPYIQNLPVRFPLGIDAFLRGRGVKSYYDYFFAFESVTEWITEQEQGNVYDHLFSLAGFDPNNIEQSYKRPVWGYLDQDIAMWKIWKESIGLECKKEIEMDKNGAVTILEKEVSDINNVGDNDEKYVMFQFSTTNKVRNPPNSVIIKILDRLNDIGLKIICFDDKPCDPELLTAMSFRKNCQFVQSIPGGIRGVATALVKSSMIVAPDSMALHFAAVFATPAIGIWGPFSPESRCKYYNNQFHLYHPEKCSFSPCFNYKNSFPIEKCPEGKETLTCEVFNGITSEEINNVVTECVKKI